MKSLENRIDELDFLRGIAILMVMATHTNLYFPINSTISSIIGFGRFGVQLFFVISAFTMINVYLKNNNFSKEKFYIKKFLEFSHFSFCLQ